MDAVEVSSADIARLAGVRPTAVSNWRRRHSDFPAPVGGTEKSPRFSLDEIRQWLAAQGRNIDVGSQREFEHAVNTAAVTTPVAETLRNALFALLDHAGEERTDEHGWRMRLQADANRLTKEQPGLADGDAIDDIDTAQATMLNAALEAAGDLPVRELAADLYDEVVTRRLGKGDTATPAELADLMVRLAEPGEGPLVDLACGAGSILMAAARHGCREVAGTETNAARAQLAALRLRAEHFEPAVSVSIKRVDALGNDPFGPGTAAAVATNPPFNDRNWAQDIQEDEPWWIYGIPSSRDSELAWLQRALFQLRPEGIAAVVMPPSAAMRPSGQRIRRRMLSDGAIKAVFALPRGSFHGTSLAPHLWLMSRSSAPSLEQHVLTADFSDYTAEPHRPDWGRIANDAVAAWSAFRRGKDLPISQARATSVMTLLEGNADLTPGRYLPFRLPAPDLQWLEQQRSATSAQVGALADRMGSIPGTLPELTGAVRWETMESLAQASEVSLHRGLPSEGKPGPETATIRTVHADSSGREGQAPVEPGQHVPRIREGDLLAAVYGERLWVRQATADDLDAAPAWGTAIIRTDPRQIDPAFLAGFLSSTLAHQQLARSSTSMGVNSMRDLLRIRVALPNLQDQRRYAGLFTVLAEVAVDAEHVAARTNELTRAWRDSAWAAIVGTDPVE
ncbi:N-6 DNA methylase [Glycomyces rhizosphaerae]|uniref:N-6 DNA methylase n=1 Tax=Glycomyces rhizosphaerae TaxID=2054422 RepID=A0ABV7Q4D0_9ACTN